MAYTLEEIGKRAKERNPELAKFSDAEIGDRLVKRNPNLATLVAPKAQEAPAQAPKSFGRKVADVFTGSTQKFADTLGAAAAYATGETQKIDEAKMAEAESRFNLAKQLRTAGPEQAARIKSQLGQGTDVQTATETIPALMKTNKQVFGEGIGSGLEAMSGGILSSGKKIAAGAVAKPVAQTLGGAIKAGAKTGAIYGTVGGTSQGMQQNKSNLGILGSAATGAGIGAGIGGALGAATYGISKGIQKTGEVITKQQNKFRAGQAEKAKLLQSGAPDSRVATVKLEQGKVVADQKARELVNQGVDEADVALIRAASPKDKAKALKMLDIREAQLTNKRVTNRATDVVGDTFMGQAKHIENANKQAAVKLNKVAMGLAGKKADPSKAVQGLADDLEKAGVTIKGGKLSFRNSDYEGVPTAQRALQNAWTRAMRVAKTGDALQMHRAKTFIDEVVDYGKAAEGLSGRSQRILKNFRHNIDGALDSKFPAYNQANTQFSETITELHKIAESMGRRFKIGDSFADARAGVVMRRILSNTQSRSDILQLLESMQAVARKYGMKIDDDIITQAQFADILEKMLGSEAPTSFLGQIERGLSGAQAATSAGTDLARGNVVSGTMKAGKYAIDILKGANRENLIKALRAMLDDAPKIIPKGNASGVVSQGLLKPVEKVTSKVAPKVGLLAKMGGVDDDLIREARKYATPEEFVKATTKDTHGSFHDKLFNSERLGGSGTKFNVGLLGPVDKQFVQVKDGMVKVFRLTKNNKILPGDFVALHPKTAETFLTSEGGSRAGGKVIEAWIPEKDLVMNGGFWNYRPSGLPSLEAVWKLATGK